MLFYTERKKSDIDPILNIFVLKSDRIVVGMAFGGGTCEKDCDSEKVGIK